MSRKTLALAVAGLAVPAAALIFALHETPLDCSGGGRLCAPLPEMEEGSYKLQSFEEHANRRGVLPKGARLAAYEAKLALEKSDIPGASGRWEQYGMGPLKGSGLAHTIGIVALPDTYLHDFSGRVDNFAYDPIAKRLFAAVGNGGIWMSEARGGDERTIGDYWISIGEKLPTQANGAVLWTSAGGGTVISAGGDSVMSTGAYPGLGAFWSNDLGASWHRAEGFPDDVNVFNAATDPGNPNILYIASSRGLFRSEDAGRSFRNVRLPVGPNAGMDCAGVEDQATPCNLASIVSDVVVQAPGGTSGVICSSRGCPVLAAVGWRAGQLAYPDTEIAQSPANGMYKSDTGEAGSFRRLELPAVDPITEAGFTPPERIGRIEMGNAWGPLQDHGYVYALVQDAGLLNAVAEITLDPPLDALGALPLATLINGMFVSADFGETWTRMADSVELATMAGPFTALVQPGGQSWYNQWIEPDPTRAVPVLGTPTRLMFGLEELFQNIGSVLGIPLNGTAQIGPQDFHNIGYYFSATGVDLTPHPDQHAGIFVPITLPGGLDGGVCVFAGNDGGVNRQCALPGQPFEQRLWGGGNNDGFYTLMPYGVSVAKDGTAWFGLQDNGSGHIEPDTREMLQDFGADGFYTVVDPDNSDVAVTTIYNGSLNRTTNRGGSNTSIAPPYTAAPFVTWIFQDPLDGKHAITGANEVFETVDWTSVTGSTWAYVYGLGFNKKTDDMFIGQVADVHGPAIYVGACGACGVTANDGPFQNLLATNVGGAKPPLAETDQGWHDATASGLPNRNITAIEIDPDDPSIVYVGLGGFQSNYRDAGSFGEDSTGADVDAGYLFKSTDAGETFVSIQGDLPQTTVSAILARNGQLVVGTDYGVFVSSDEGGSQWGVLGEGLPNAPVTQFQLQPGNPNKLFAALFGRHVWTYEWPADARIDVQPGINAPKDESRFGGALGLPFLVMLLGALRRHRQ